MFHWPVMQVVKRSPQDTDLMVTPDWPSRKREMNWGCICSTTPGRLVSPDPTDGACDSKWLLELNGCERGKKNISKQNMLKGSIGPICDIQCPTAIILLLNTHIPQPALSNSKGKSQNIWNNCLSWSNCWCRIATLFSLYGGLRGFKVAPWGADTKTRFAPFLISEKKIITVVKTCWYCIWLENKSVSYIKKLTQEERERSNLSELFLYKTFLRKSSISNRLTQTSHVISRPDLVTPIFWVRPRDTCSTSVLSIGRRRGAEIPLPHVYTEDSGRECSFPDPKPMDPSV